MKVISNALSEKFPNTRNTKLGKQRHLYFLGMDVVQEQGESASCSSSSISTSSDDPALKAALKEFEHQNHLLQERIDEQQQQVPSLDLATTLDTQVNQLLSWKLWSQSALLENLQASL